MSAPPKVSITISSPAEPPDIRSQKSVGRTVSHVKGHPLQHMPSELWEHVFYYISTDTQSLLTIFDSCKFFRQLVKSSLLSNFINECQYLPQLINESLRDKIQREREKEDLTQLLGSSPGANAFSPSSPTATSALFSLHQFKVPLDNSQIHSYLIDWSSPALLQFIPRLPHSIQHFIGTLYSDDSAPTKYTTSFQEWQYYVPEDSMTPLEFQELRDQFSRESGKRGRAVSKCFVDFENQKIQAKKDVERELRLLGKICSVKWSCKGREILFSSNEKKLHKRKKKDSWVGNHQSNGHTAEEWESIRNEESTWTHRLSKRGLKKLERQREKEQGKLVRRKSSGLGEDDNDGFTISQLPSPPSSFEHDTDSRFSQSQDNGGSSKNSKSKKDKSDARQERRSSKHKNRSKGKEKDDRVEGEDEGMIFEMEPDVDSFVPNRSPGSSGHSNFNFQTPFNRRKSSKNLSTVSNAYVHPDHYLPHSSLSGSQSSSQSPSASSSANSSLSTTPTNPQITYSTSPSSRKSFSSSLHPSSSYSSSHFTHSQSLNSSSASVELPELTPSLLTHILNQFSQDLDPSHRALKFPEYLTSYGRKHVHIIAERLGLETESIGEGKGRFVVVRRV
ncbi:hypothetical protein BKA69DRAFT_1037228 [Paraphysoderma sedebokerense]|nr:hypothetical protein BKA69DRAFT_1037228 [Paraphysoderma sedebokerense]